MKIYTKSGDGGDTGLIGGQRVPKDDTRIEAYGTVDELSSILGMARSSSPAASITPMLGEIQRDLFSLGAELASPNSAETGPSIDNDDVQRMEAWIDEWQAPLPPLRHFILPGGTPTAGLLHLARGICRRAERRVVTLARAAHVRPEVIPYLNRLSDLLFVLARAENHAAGVDDVIWEPSQK